MDNQRMAELVLAMFRKERAIWSLHGNAERMAEIDDAERLFRQTCGVPDETGD